ncbi:aminotransferase class I/II-fold pyridoxal phosphate-dependent enzyme [Thiothrix lacustris]|uniref:aminotransferase class I/II-fold pyridoxal phosphate-dependent enzyme n=1 Tax=Thiothrix lacustris TaxID=525917 RepID=UPI0027E4AB08|nr:aminotransferase class I/II-fold pyridoxal phosphate-dependent enzyme [Thiothrix lacustris]WMP19415.1 aminotransferase class I/II-fold pyridoxal phosphate-dependent enzyme [Thiothrix lacustris]
MNPLAQQISQMSPLKVALAAQQVASKMALVNADPIAIIGIGCRFPGGANNPEQYWQLLTEGRDAVGEMATAGRWDMDKYYDPNPETPGKMTVRHGGFLENVDKFDAQFFGISPREAVVLDPQQRLLLEVTWEALENAGIVPSTLHNSATGVYVGITTSEYEKLCLQSDTIQKDNNHIAYMGTGNDTCAAAGRLSYSLGLTGPSLSVNTACSSSLVATHLACESLRHRTSNLAIAGGVNLTLIPDIYVVFSKAGMLSPDGRCKTFDASANGYVRGEGCGILILKRLSDAVADGDNVLAIIRGSAVNQDGRSSGLTVPNGPAQQAVIRQALDNSGVNPSQVGYVEAHGTGTSLGDPIEVGALGEVFRGERDSPLLIGSAKTNIGHLESGAGAAGLIKTVLSLQHGEIPPNLHFQHPSPHIEWDKLPIKVVTERTAWLSARRIAGVSSFGYSGTNSHIVLEAAPTLNTTANSAVERPQHLLTLSARSKDALAELATSYTQHLQNHADASLADLCFSANTRRTVFPYRLAVAATSRDELMTQLAAFAKDEPSQVLTGAGADAIHAKTAFLFTGQGSQYVGMGYDLYTTQPTFRQALERCDEILRPHLQHALLDVMYPGHANTNISPELINDTAYTQPALFAIEYALATLWQSWGIKPDVMLGHSVGEYPAACLAGVFSLEDGLRLIAARGRLMQALPRNGGMVSIMADEASVAEAIRPYAATVSLAAINGSRSVVIAGETQAVQAIAAQFADAGVKTQALTVSHAFHSPLMEPMLADFAEVANSITYHAPSISMVSNITGKVVTHEMSNPAYWVQHVREAVHFNDGMNTLATQGCNVFLEIGAKPVLLGMGRQCVQVEDALWMPSLRPKRGDWQQLLESLGELFVHNVGVDWKGFEQDYVRHAVNLPTYPFQRLRHWLPASSPAKRNTGALRPLVDKLLQSPLLKETLLETTFSTANLPFLEDHKVFEEIVVPGASHLAVILSGAELLGMTACQFEDVIFPAPLTLPEGQARTVQVVMTPDEDSQTFQLISTSVNDLHAADAITHATGRLAEHAASTARTAALPTLQARCKEVIEPDSLYDIAAEQFIVFGPSFRWIEGLWRGDGEALARFSLPDSIGSLEGYWLHPGLLDACFQTAGVTLNEEASSDTLLPFMLKNMQVFAVPQGQAWWCHVVQVGATAWDIQLFDDAGQVLINISGFEMRKAPRDAMQRRHLADWLYTAEWQPKPLEKAAFAQEPGSWLIFSDSNGIGKQLNVQLQENWQTAVVVKAGTGYSADAQQFTIDPSQAADYHRLIDEAFTQTGTACRGVVYLWGTEAQISPEAMPALAQRLSVGLLHTVQALRHSKLAAKLWLVTQGAQASARETHLPIAQAALWGFGRTLAIEQPDMACTCLDLSPAAEDDNITALLTELAGHDGEDQIAWRSGTRQVARLAPYQEAAQGPTQPDGPFRVQLANYGSPDELHLVPITRRAPAAHEVEVEVKTTALNFRDVLNSLGMLKDYYAEVLGIKRAEDVPLGFECAGTIVAVGADVTDLQVGDEVAVATEGSFASFVTVEAYCVARKPASLSFEAAAGVPTAFLTAYYALHNVAQLQAGDRILIHSAAGGVGQAAVQLAQAVGAEIFATASPSKWDALKAQGIQHVMNSRTLDFADEIMQITAGRGVDVILNSLNGDFIDKSFAVLAQGGRLVEIGKIGIWDEAKVAAIRPDAQYYPFDLGEVTTADPSLMTSMLNAVMQGFEAGTLSPLPQTTFPITQVADAYRYMQQTKHIGKVVLTFTEETPAAIHADGSYLVTGGLGGLGLQVAQYLADQGARHLVLSSRSGANSEDAQTLVQQLTEQGINVSVVKADVANAEDVARMLDVAQSQAPLRGIIHAAGLIDDGGVLQQTPERFARVMAPKVLGAWLLHNQTQNLPLDFFISFSSIASLMGSPGQTNYAAANAVVDLLMQQRRAQGLPGISINWGPWAETGMAADLSFESEGLDKIAPDAGIQVLAELIQRAPHMPAQIGVFPMNWSKFMQQFPAGQVPPFVSQMQRKQAPRAKAASTSSSDILQRLQTASAAERQDLLIAYISAQLTQVLGLEASQSTPPDQHWNELGLDSLMTVELKNRLDRALHVSIPLETIMQEATTQLLAGMVIKRMDDKVATQGDDGAPVEDAYAKNQAGLDAEVAMLQDIPQTYVNVDEQRERQVLIDGRWRCDFASCNYLGMDLHPDVINSIPAALDKWGVHPSWTRAVASPGLYPELEQELADLLGSPTTLVFPSIHLLHLGVLPMLAGFNGVILKDNAAHHSIYEACLRSQADGIEWLEFAHNDLADLERKLSRYRPEQSKIIAIDGVYSMSGEFPPLPEMSALAKKYNALIYVDDAHGVGVIGENPTEDMPYGHGGCGIVKYFGLDYEADRIIYVGGLSKSFSSYGAFITCFDQAMKSRLSLAGPFVFSGPSPVASLASALAGLKVNRTEGERMRRQVYHLTSKLVSSAKAMGYEVDNEHNFPIVGVVIGNIDEVTAACKLLWEYDVLITPAIYPAVPMHRNLVRFSITASNTEVEIDQAIKGLQAVWDMIHAEEAVSA